VALLGLAGLAAWCRLSAWSEVFVGGHVLTRDPDADYHLRRISQILGGVEGAPFFDRGLNWPDGAACPWTPGFDWLGVLLARAAGAGPGAGADRVAAFLPILLGVGLVLGVFALCSRVGPRTSQGFRTALSAGAFAAVLPRMVMSSQLGRVDHHVFEAGFMLCLGLGVLWAAAEAPDRPRTRPQWVSFELLGGLVVWVGGAGFTGSILHVAIAAGILMALRIEDRAPSPARSGWRLLWGSGAIALLLGGVGLLALGHAHVRVHAEPLTFKLPSYLQGFLHLAAALGCAAAAAVGVLATGERRRFPRTRLRVAVLASLLCVAALVAAPVAGASVRAGLTEWLGRGDPWLASIEEFAPLLPSWRLWEPATARALYDFNGLPGMLAPIALPVGLWLAVRADRRVGLCFAAWTLCLVPLVLMQNRFGQIASANYAVCLALCLSAGAERVARWMAASTGGTAEGGVGTPSFYLVAFVAALGLLDPAIRHELRWQDRGEPSAIEAVSLYLANAMPGAGLAPGVLAGWGYGHTVLRLTGRPVLTAGFGPYTGERSFLEAQSFPFLDESALGELMDRRRLGFVVTGMRAEFPAPGDRPGDPRKPFLYDATTRRVVPSAGYFQRHPLMSTILGGTGIAELGVAHVAHLMPLFASPQAAQGLGFPLQRLWLFERVPGATLRGRARASALVVARTGLEIYGAPTAYSAWTRADATGRFELVIPLPNDLRTPALHSGARYDLVVDDVPRGGVQISEDDVRGGASIDMQPPRLPRSR
jgi:hypothetical protein